MIKQCFWFNGSNSRKLNKQHQETLQKTTRATSTIECLQRTSTDRISERSKRILYCNPSPCHRQKRMDIRPLQLRKSAPRAVFDMLAGAREPRECSSLTLPRQNSTIYKILLSCGAGECRTFGKPKHLYPEYRRRTPVLFSLT